MGIIKQQTIKGTIYSFSGVIVGFVNLAIISPIIFSTEQIGLIQVVVAIATILSQIGGLGFNNVTNRIFPYFRSKDNGHNGYLSLTFLVTTLGLMLCLIFWAVYMPSFVENNAEKSRLLSEYAIYIPVLVGIMMLLNILDNYCKVLFNAAIGIFLREFVLRLINLSFLVVFYMGLIDFGNYVLLYVLAQAVPAIILIIYLIIKGEFVFSGFRSFLTPDMVRHILSLAGFGIIAGLSGIALTNIDKYMVNRFIGLSDAGVYSIAVYFATLILIPSRSLGKIAVPVISEAWKSNDRKVIQEIYYRSSINQFIIGLLIFIGIIANLDNIFRLLPAEYSRGSMVIIFFGLANLVNVAAGAGKMVLSTSDHYKYQTYLMIILIAIVIISNLIFIPVMGINGAALASLISMTIYTGLIIVVLKRFYGLWPFKRNHVFMIIISGLVLLLSYLIPQLPLLADIVLRSLMIIVLFSAGVIVSGASEEAKEMFDRFLSLARRR